jgi:peptide/nickel transport system permease protein
MRSVWKHPFFLIGFSFIVIMLIASFGYTLFFHDTIRKFFYLMNERHQITEAAPLHPRSYIPFGTDELGYDMLGKILMGAKFTILAALSVALLRMVMAIPLGFFLGVYLKKSRKYVEGVVDSFHYVPLTIVAVYILLPVLTETPGEGFNHSLFVRMFIEVFLLAILTVPVSATLIGKEASLLYRQDFVESARTLGASKQRIIRKHLYPILRDKLFIMFGQEVIQTLIVLSHLGVLRLFFGGTHISNSPVAPPPSSITNEWSGLIGVSFRYTQTAPWMALTPIIFFALTMLSVALMIEGYVQATTGRSHYFRKRSRKKKVTNIHQKELSKDNEFDLYKHTG